MFFLYNISYIKEAIDVFDKVIAKNLEYTYKNFKFNAKFDKAFFNKNEFKDGDIACVGIITKIENNDENKIKNKTNKK